MSRNAAVSTESRLSWLVVRRNGVAELMQSLESAKRQDLGVDDLNNVGALDDLDRASSVQARDAANLLASFLSASQLQIERAFQRIADGSYGVCEDCRLAISSERLMARPEATRCVECQRRHELISSS
jgi:RNA polymerase-binding transcription factor DksA